MVLFNKSIFSFIISLGFLAGCSYDQPSTQIMVDTHSVHDTVVGHSHTKEKVVHGRVDIENLSEDDSDPSYEDTLTKYDIWHPHHCHCNREGDSLVMQFDVGLDCNAEFTGSAYETDSILYIYYYDPNGSSGVASRYCNYRFVFRVLDRPYKKIFPVTEIRKSRFVFEPDFMEILKDSSVASQSGK